MKTIITFFTTLIIISFFAFHTQAQEAIATSKGLIGLWRQYVPAKNPQGEIVLTLTGNYKLLNVDGGFINFITWPNRTEISVYGNYIITSDSTYTENVIHAMNSGMNGKPTLLRYKLKNENILLIQYYLEKESNGQKIGTWIPEIWKRVEMPYRLTDSNLL